MENANAVAQETVRKSTAFSRFERPANGRVVVTM
jgi:hypothetical protein